MHMYKKCLLGVAAAVAVFALAACGSDEPAPVLVSVQVRVNGNLTPGVPVRYEDPSHPRLKELRERENLDAVVLPGRSEFENILAMKDWVAAQWPHSTPDPYPPWDAITILDWIRGGVTGGFCGQYSQVLLQALAAFGYQSRYIEIGSVDNPWAHFVVEVWSNDYNKWVVMDADYNVHFMRDGIPLSAIDLHEALVRDRTSEITAVLGPTRDGHGDPDTWPQRTIELYYYLRLILKGDHLSDEITPAIDRYNDSLEWSDEYTVPWDQSEVPSIYVKERISNMTHSERATWAAKLNQVHVTVESLVDGAATLRFENNSRDFVTYRIVEFDVVRRSARNTWTRHDSPTFVWTPSPGTALLVQAMDSQYRPGPASEVSAFYARPK